MPRVLTSSVRNFIFSIYRNVQLNVRSTLHKSKQLIAISTHIKLSTFLKADKRNTEVLTRIFPFKGSSFVPTTYASVNSEKPGWQTLCDTILASKSFYPMFQLTSFRQRERLLLNSFIKAYRTRIRKWKKEQKRNKEIL